MPCRALIPDRACVAVVARGSVRSRRIRAKRGDGESRLSLKTIGVGRSDIERGRFAGAASARGAVAPAPRAVAVVREEADLRSRQCNGVAVGVGVGPRHRRRPSRIELHERLVREYVRPSLAIGADDVEFGNHSEYGMEENVAMEDPPAVCASGRHAVHERPVFDTHSEAQRVLRRYVDIVSELAVRPGIRRSRRLREVQRLNREAVEVEWMICGRRQVLDCQLQRVAEFRIARRGGIRARGVVAGTFV